MAKEKRPGRQRPTTATASMEVESTKKPPTTSGSLAGSPAETPTSTAGKQSRIEGNSGPTDSAWDESDDDERIEIEEEYNEIDQLEKVDMDDEVTVSDLDYGLGEGDSHEDGKVVSKKRKKAGVAVALVMVKEKKTRKKRVECWKYFKLVNAMSKRKPDEVVVKAKCLYCFGLYVYAGGSTSMNRHKKSCAQILNQKARALRQGTIAFDPQKPGASLIVNNEYDHEECKRIIAKMIIVHEYPFRMAEHAWFNILMKYMMLPTSSLVERLLELNA